MKLLPPLIADNLISERSVETRFVDAALNYLRTDNIQKILDVGGVPTDEGFQRLISFEGYDRKVCDFRSCDYTGDFVTLEISEVFDVVLFLSSLEHFPQCTESDLIKRPGYDRKGFKKALDILKPKGKIILTVPYGVPVWQNYHQNYDADGIVTLTEGSSLLISQIYKLNTLETQWLEADLTDNTMRYDTRARGVGCFIFEKD